MKEPVIDTRRQLLAFSGLATAVIVVTAFLHWSDARLFQRFLGAANPVLTMITAAVAGMLVLFLVLRQWHFFLYKKQPFSSLIPLLGLVVALAVIMILVDLQAPFPADINILFPESLLFYPAIAFLVEILFHVLPLGLLLLILRPVILPANHKKVRWVVIVLVALLEPVYQLFFLVGKVSYSPWKLIFIGLHLFLFNLLQLYTFQRRDFFSMYLLRLTYYLIWHIAWGQIRLGVLF